ncbi:MAG: hypothetical protein RBS43_07825, partial [Candidatus Cloacimonas sp.]|nr:hypothetical protein [Candidatus Cloacimonas sp.]
MMKKQLKLLLLLSIMALLALPLLAKHSDEFLLGSYSYLKNGKQVNYANREALCRYMQKLGYNSNIIETDANDPDLSGLLAELDKHGIDAWITDRGWNTSPDSEYRYSSYPLSLSNHLRFEAEFASESDVKKGDAEDNQYWYAARSDVNLTRIGSVSTNPNASYGNVWQANKANDKAGYIFTDLRHRWPNKNGAYVRFGKEFHLYKKNPPSYEGDYLWVNFNFKLSNVSADLAPEEPLLRFMLAGYELSGGGFASQPKMLTHKYKDMSLPESLYRVKDYSQLKDTGGFISIQLKVSYADLLAAKLLSADIDGDPATPDSDTQMILVNLNPRLYWYGNCDVQLDYVEIKDQIFHEISTDQATWQKRIVQRMQNIIAQGQGNVSGFYTFDEPYQGQFASFKLMQNMVKDEGLKILTANYDYQVDNITISPQKRLFYDHEDNFRKVAEPILLAPDIYPITPVTRWNPEADKENQPYFIQNILDNKLIKVYRESKHYSLENKQRQFYPIVQALGYWVNQKGQNQWNSWVQPPTATQKTLLYMPLCFGADGIFHYRLRGFQDTAGLGEYTTLSSRQGTKNYPLPNEDLTTYTAVAATNQRVKSYGKIIRNLSWLESYTIGTDKAPTALCPKNTMLNSLQVQKAGNGAYEGYMQCGYYLDSKGLPYYMIVNRRGEYFVPGTIT